MAPFEQVEFDMANKEAVQTAFAEIGELDHLLVAAGPTDGSWGTFMDEGMNGARSYADAKFFGSWARARYAEARGHSSA